MFPNPLNLKRAQILSLGATTGILCSGLILEGLNPNFSQASPMLEFRWDNSTGYKKLYYHQSSTEKRARSTYFLALRKHDRKNAILKLRISIPNNFTAKINSKKIKLCRVQLGGMLSRTKCIEKIPAVFEIDKKQINIEIFPDTPIPTGDSYAVVMKIFNPIRSGMFQFNALAQAPGDIPVSRYLGSWNISIE